MNQLQLSPNPKVVSHLLEGDGKIPNNPTLPLLAYIGVTEGDSEEIARLFEKTVEGNQWRASWRWSVYDYHHFHSNAHEALGCYRGSATVLFGGDHGVKLEIKAGDFVVIPAGVGHKLLKSSGGFNVVGSYPIGQTHDTHRANKTEIAELIENISRTPLPLADPLYGPNGPLASHWHLRE